MHTFENANKMLKATAHVAQMAMENISMAMLRMADTALLFLLPLLLLLQLKISIILKWKKLIVKIFRDFKIETEMVHSDVPPLDTPEHLSIVPIIRELSKEKLITVAYAAEAGQFSEAGFEAVICGPGDIVQAHRANEFISKDQLNQGVEFMCHLVKKLSQAEN